MSNLSTMESLKLPAELYWNGKVEPTSPLASELFSVTNYDIVNWIEEDNIANETNLPINDLKSKLDLDDSIELLSGDEVVIELCDIIEKNWDNTKPQTPSTTFVDDYMLDSSIQQQNVLTKVCYENLIDSTTCLSSASGGSYNSTDLYATSTSNSNLDTAILTQLTPPHSPPLQNIHIVNNQQFISPASKFNVDFQQIQQQQQTVPNFLNISQQLQIPEYHENIGNVTIDSSLVKATAADIQTQIVDEIVNSRAQELVDWNDEFESLSSSSSSSFAAYDFSEAHVITDEEILPNSSPVHIDHLQDTSNDFSAASTPIPTTAPSTPLATPVAVITIDQLKKRTRPYGRAPEDRKLRKKEQNKYAATRYRQKKKLEMEYILTEEQNLSARHEELKRQLEERKREVKYLKTLLREFYYKQKQLKQQQ